MRTRRSGWRRRSARRLRACRQPSGLRFKIADHLPGFNSPLRHIAGRPCVVEFTQGGCRSLGSCLRPSGDRDDEWLKRRTLRTSPLPRKPLPKRALPSRPQPSKRRPRSGCAENAVAAARPPCGGHAGFGWREAAHRAQPSAAELYEEIRRRAYELYCERGGKHGSHEADWHRAELEVRSKYR